MRSGRFIRHAFHGDTPTSSECVRGAVLLSHPCFLWSCLLFRFQVLRV